MSGMTYNRCFLRPSVPGVFEPFLLIFRSKEKMIAENIYDLIVVSLGLFLFTFILLVFLIAQWGGMKEVKEFFRVDCNNFLQGCSDRLESAVLTYRVVYIIILFFVVEFSYAWYFETEQMKLLTHAIVIESYVIARPVMDGVVAVWQVIANPWRLIGYVLFLFLLRLRPELLGDIVKG